MCSLLIIATDDLERGQLESILSSLERISDDWMICSPSIHALIGCPGRLISAAPFGTSLAASLVTGLLFSKHEQLLALCLGPEIPSPSILGMLRDHPSRASMVGLGDRGQLQALPGRYHRRLLRPFVRALANKERIDLVSMLLNMGAVKIEEKQASS